MARSRTVFIAADALTDNDKGRVPLANAQWGPALNAGLSITGSINPKTVDRDLVAPFATIIYVYRDDRLMGGSIVESLEPADNSQELDLTCMGFETYPTTQYLEESLTPAVYADPLDVARSLWTYMQAQPDADLGLVLDSLTTNGKVKVGTPDDLFRMDWWDTRSIGDYIQALSGSDNGFDFRIDVSQDSSGVRTKRLVHGYPRLGARRNDLRFDDRANVTSLPQNSTVNAPITDVIVTGSGTGRSMLRATSGRRNSGQLRKMVVAPDPAEKNQANLNARARSELAARSVEVDIQQLQLRDHPNARLGSFAPGDDVYTSLHSNWNDFDGWMRVMGWQFIEGSVDNASQENILVDVARADQFVYGPNPDIDFSIGGSE